MISATGKDVILTDSRCVSVPITVKTQSLPGTHAYRTTTWFTGPGDTAASADEYSQKLYPGLRPSHAFNCYRNYSLGWQRPESVRIHGTYTWRELVRGYDWWEHSDFFSLEDTKVSGGFTVRVRSKAYISPKRLTGKKKDYVVLTPSADRANVDISPDWFQDYPYASGAIQVKSGKRWKHLKAVKLNRTGVATVTIKAPKRAEYRFVAAKTSTTTDSTSGVAKR